MIFNFVKSFNGLVFKLLILFIFLQKIGNGE